MNDTIVTIFKNAKSPNEPYYITLDKALERIRSGSSKNAIGDVRSIKDKTQRNERKKEILPQVCFDAKLSHRKKDGVIEPTGLATIDFDDVNVIKTKNELRKNKYCYAYWMSPSGTGVKALFRIPKDKDKYNNYYYGLLNSFGKDADHATIDISFGAYESYDPDIYINENAIEFTDFIDDIYNYKRVRKLKSNPESLYKQLKSWLEKTDDFVNGNRNHFVFKLTCNANRFGIDKDALKTFMAKDFSDSGFYEDEIDNTIDSAYERYNYDFGTAKYNTVGEAKKISERDYDGDPKELIDKFDDIENKLHKFYDDELPTADETGSELLDRFLPFKHNEFMFAVGAGGMGKTSWALFYVTLSIVKADWNWILVLKENERFEMENLIINYIVGKIIKTPKHSSLYVDYKKEVDEAKSIIRKHIIFLKASKIKTFADIDAVYLMLKNQDVRIDGIMVDPMMALGVLKEYSGKGDAAAHDAMSHYYRDWAEENCTLFFTTHTTSDSQRGDAPPKPQHALFGGRYHDAAHISLTLYRNIYSEDRYYYTEIRISKQRTMLSKGGELTKGESLDFEWCANPFGFRIHYGNDTELCPLIKKEEYADYYETVKNVSDMINNFSDDRPF